MKNSITKQDKEVVIDFINQSDRYTNGPKVKELEELWSSWLGVDYSLFVSSGSSANLILISAIIDKYNLKRGDKVLVPAMTWVTNISPIIQLGLEPVFCDVDIKNFSFDLDHFSELAKLHHDIRVVFVTHLFGIAAPINEFKKIIPNAIYIEDCCESHGAEIDGKKVGTFSLGSTFSSYFGHHMNTIEGGFVSTNNFELYELLKAKRSHGLARETSKETFNKYRELYPEVDEDFLFITDGFNCRNTEINAVLGIEQVKRLDSFISKRRMICDKFVNILKKYGDVFFLPDFEGNSSFCLPFILKDSVLRVRLKEFLETGGVETRPLCSGNLLRQPFLAGYTLDKEDSGVDYLHYHGFFIGNHHMIEDDDIDKLESLLDDFFEDKVKWIYESPDGGKTSFRRAFGGTVKEKVNG